jgi:hypothetical protein
MWRESVRPLFNKVQGVTQHFVSGILNSTLLSRIIRKERRSIYNEPIENSDYAQAITSRAIRYSYGQERDTRAAFKNQVGHNFGHVSRFDIIPQASKACSARNRRPTTGVIYLHFSNVTRST